MGRYYSGDIEGKFWFALQNSNAADRFGREGSCSYLQYYFEEDSLDGVEAEIAEIETKLGDKLHTLDKFFEEHDGYNDKMLEDIGITREDLSEYADLHLGKKIATCIIENGTCQFDAEL